MKNEDQLRDWCFEVADSMPKEELAFAIRTLLEYSPDDVRKEALIGFAPKGWKEIMAGSSIRKGIKKAFAKVGLKNFDLGKMYMMPGGDSHLYCVPRYTLAELKAGPKQSVGKKATKPATALEIAKDAVFDADRWLRLQPEELEGMSRAEKREMIAAAVDEDIEDYFRSSPYEIDETKIPSIKKQIVSALAAQV